MLGGVVERHEAFFVALAAHNDNSGFAAGGRSRKRNQFGDAQPGGVEKLDETGEPGGAKPRRQRRRGIGLPRYAQQAIDFGKRQCFR